MQHRLATASSGIQRVQLAGPPARAPGAAGRRRRQPATAAVSAVNGGGRGSDTQDTLVSDGAIKSLSPEARRIFREAQDNIIELNKSRLRALEELKAARQKIAELEEKLECAVQDASQATIQLQQMGPTSQQAAAAVAAAAAASQQPLGEVTAAFNQQQQAQAAAAGGPSITVVYETGWGSAFLHFNADGSGWTAVPGTKMQNGNQQFPDKKVITVPGRRLEFVVNDGGNDWDKPATGAGNYVVNSPGTYRLKNGKLTKLA